MAELYGESRSVVVVGRGPAGLTAAIALAQGGLSLILAGKPAAKSDNRTTALLAGSVTALETLGVWNLCAAQAAPLKVMRIADDTGRLWRAPEVMFQASDGRTAAVKTTDEAILRASLVIGADGRNSICRAAARIGTDERRYPQVALTLCVRHSRPHQDTSTEFHTRTGPFTLVPLPGKRSSVVWVLDRVSAEDVAALDDAELAREIERASHSIVGKIEVEPGRGRFPLHIATARRFADKRIALVGEAAHVVPPIGAQGLNMGLRDAATISEVAIAAHRNGLDIGNPDVLARYETMRQADVRSRTLTVDLLNRTLLSDFLPAQGMRGLGLYLIDRIGPLRRAVMREGVGPASRQPRLMRGEAL
jgi:2-octaprenyl-6-methoxyphenol hydroxylase